MEQTQQHNIWWWWQEEHLELECELNRYPAKTSKLKLLFLPISLSLLLETGFLRVAVVFDAWPLYPLLRIFPRGSIKLKTLYQGRKYLSSFNRIKITRFSISSLTPLDSYQEVI